MRLLKTLHGWLGLFVMPWAVMIGLTGLLLNHQGLVTGLLDAGAYDETQFDAWPDPRPMTPDTARALAERRLPGASITVEPDKTYHGRKAAIFRSGETQVIVALQSGHYWVKTPFRRVTHAPDGQVLATKVYWESLFKRLHVRGWPDRSFGTWLADLTAAAMVVFGLSGIILFLVPRLRRLQNRRRRKSPG